LNDVNQVTTIDALRQVFEQMAKTYIASSTAVLPKHATYCACDMTHATHGLPSAVTWVKHGLMGATINNMVVLSDKQVGDGVL